MVASEAKKCGDVLARQLAQRLAREAEIDDRAGAPGEVDHRARQRLVERRERRAEAGDAAPRAQRLIERLAERQRAVLDRVVVVDLEVAGAGEPEIEPGVPGERAQHVVEKADAALDLALAAAVEGELDRDPGLEGLAGDLGLARAHRTAHGTIWASAVTTMSVPPLALISGITRGRSLRGTAALSAKP